MKDVEVVDATSRAFLAIPDAKAAVTALTELKGIGPATASAVLALFSPSFPFMSDEVITLAFGNLRLYFEPKNCRPLKWCWARESIL